MKCFYHSADLDGHCSGAIVRDRYSECQMVGIDYGDTFPWDSVGHEVVFMVDFSLPIQDMLRLKKNCALLVWIDHHKTAIDARNAAGASFCGIQSSGIGACALTWRHLHPDRPMPYGVQLLAEYDVWNHRDKNCLPFQYGMRAAQNTLPGAPLWDLVFAGEIDDIILRGDAVLAYERKQSEMYAKAFAFETTLHGLRCVAMNRMLTNSKAFDSVVDPQRHDAMLTFGFLKGVWKCSLYSVREDVDVSAVALKYGGGGHKAAAGFHCPELPFEYGR